MASPVEIIDTVGHDEVDLVESKSIEPCREIFNYTILAPRSFRANSDFMVNLTIHDATSELNDAVIVRISIEDEDDEIELNIHRDVTLKSNVTEFVSLAIGNISPDRNYKFVAKGISGCVIQHESDLDLQNESKTIQIQSDKAIYKPNDCIRFRILVLDRELKAVPINENELIISVTDSQNKLMKKWNGVNTAGGVFSGEYTLSDVPNLGDWKIIARVGYLDKTSTIEVAEYVLPKFEIALETAEIISLDDENVRTVIRAKYTHGKPMRGSAVVSITEQSPCRCLSTRENEVAALAKKTIVFDGRKTVEFNIQDDLQFGRNDEETYHDCKRFAIKAEVTETLTGLSQSTEKTITIHRRAYKVTTDLHHVVLKRGGSVSVTISVRKQDGSLISLIEPNKRKITIIRERFFENADTNEKKETLTSQDELIRTTDETIHDLDQNGDVRYTFDVAKNECNFSLKVKFGTQEDFSGTFYTMKMATGVSDNVKLKATVLTEKCRINNEIEVELMSHFAFPSFSYVIVSRGRIVETKTIATKFADSASEFVHRFSFLPTFDYAPRAWISVYCVREQTIVTAYAHVELFDDFNNFIELNAGADLAKPGQVLDITVKSNPNSIIGLLGIDKSVLNLRDGNDLSRNEILNALDSFHIDIKHKSYVNKNKKRKLMPHYNVWKDCSVGGLITFTNTIVPCEARMHRMNACFYRMNVNMEGVCYLVPPGGGPVAPPVRKDFPETWIWDMIDGKSFNGVQNFTKKVPDSLTTWMLTGFSIDPVNGLALTRKPLEVCVQQEFHVSLSLPYSVKRGEVVTVPCSIFNYLKRDIEAEVTLENEHNEFEFVDSAIDDKIYPEIAKEKSRKKKLSIQAEDAVNAYFTIRPTKVGLISLKVSAVSPTVGDCIIETLNVECEGVPQFVNKAVFVDLRDRQQIEPIDIAIDIPKVALPYSTRIEITCVGDLLGGTIKNLQNLIRMPYGCGEQNMLNFVPNICVLNYLKNTHQLTTEIEVKAKKFMEVGYQRELSYKHKDGSFSAFGESDENGSTWLTAFVARSFRQAAEHINIDDKIVNNALKWLKWKQAENGSFIEVGCICHKEMQSGSSSGVALTAYVLTAFLMNKDDKKTYEATIEKALHNIIESVKNCTDVYALAVSAYALHLADHSSKTDVLNQLKQLAKTNENFKWWDKTIKTEGCYYRESLTLNVEVTAYAMLTLQSVAPTAECLPILKWLLNQRNDQGGFTGTQDTILGIEALATFASKIAAKDNNVKVDVTTSNNLKHHFDVNQDSALVLQSHKLTPDVKTVRIQASGKGFALLELGYRYNINGAEPEPAFSLKPLVKAETDDHMIVQITTNYQPPKGKDSDKQSNMVVLEAALPSGYVVNTDILNGLKSTSPIIKRIETKNGDTVAIIYLDHLTPDAVTFKIDGFREHIVDEQKPASILIYDYYDSALNAREFYSLPTIEPK